MTEGKKTLPIVTVICPVFNEEKTVPLFFERIKKVFAELAGRFEPRLVFVDNCSQDRTAEMIRAIYEKHPETYHFVMSRNFGYQCSVECGLRHSGGDFFVVIDVDCEDPPELLLEFLKIQEQGYDIVYGERLDREESAIVKEARRWFYRLTRFVADDYFILDMAEFCLINNDVREAILWDNNSFPFIRASIGRVGFKRKEYPYKRHKRIAGETHYNFWRMSIFAVAGILSSSTLFLRVQFYIFPFWLAAIWGIGIWHLLSPQVWAPTVLELLGFSFIGYCAVFISIYLARTYKNGLNRPNFIVNKKKSRIPPLSAHG